MDRAERSANAQHSEFDMFQTALMLENQIRERTEELEKEKEEQQHLIKKLESTQSQLIQSDKLSAIGLLASGVAHEINNPIAFVNSNFGTLSEYTKKMLTLIDAYRAVVAELPQDTPGVRHVNELLEQYDFQFLREDIASLLGESLDGIERVRRIVADLKDFSRVGEVEWQDADIHRCLNSTLSVVHNELKYKATVVKEFGDIPVVRCMPFQLNQVFLNLLINASHAIESNGAITVRTGTNNDKSQVQIEVVDNGKGIAPENLTRIFEPFFTTKPAGIGTGLGLSVSYGIIRKHNGKIEVFSEIGKGTTFRVTLPVMQGLPTPTTSA